MIHWLENNLLTCYFKAYLGINCPGCGMQRSLIALLKGEVLESLHLHAALIPSLITLTLLVFQLILKYPNGAKWVMWSFIITVSITFIQFIIRNIILFGYL